MLKSGSISKQQKGTIFPIWFALPRHSLIYSQPCWEQSCILMGAHLCLQVTAVPALPLPREHMAPLPALPPRPQSLGMQQARHWQQSWRRCVGMAFSSPAAASARSPPLLLFFRLLQLFQHCCFTASLFNPPVIRGPITPAQDVSRSLGSTKRAYLRADTAPMQGHTWGTPSQVWFVSCRDTRRVQIDPPCMEAGSWSGFGLWLWYFSPPLCPGPLNNRC